MKYHTICEEEYENKKLMRPRIDRITVAESCQKAYEETKRLYPQYKKIHVYEYVSEITEKKEN